MLYALFVWTACARTMDRSVDVEGDSARGVMGARVKVKQAGALKQISGLRGELETVRRELKRLARREDAFRRENKLLGKELIDILNRYRTQNDELKRVQLSIAAVVANGGIQAVGKREGQLLDALADISDSSRKIALKAVEFCDYVESVLHKMPMGKLERARLKVRIDELRSETRKLCSLSGAGAARKSIKKCRLLAVNPELKVVVLPVGAAHGVFNGLLYYFGKEHGRLRVIAVRPFVSAAVVEAGSFDELAPGMAVYTSNKNGKNRK